MNPQFLESPLIRAKRIRARFVKLPGALASGCVGVIIGVLITANFAAASPFRGLKILATVLQEIDRSYVEGVDQDAVVLSAAKAMVQGSIPTVNSSIWMPIGH